MNLFVLLLVVCLVFKVTCDKSLVSQQENKSFRNVKNSSKRSPRHGEIVFCDIGCVLYDPKSSPLIDDPGRNFYGAYSVLSTSYVIEVVGTNHGLKGKTLRVMLSDRVLARRPSGTSASLQVSGGLGETLELEEAKLIQRITFNLHACVSVSADTGEPEEFTARIPHVVPHVVFMHNYELDHRGERVTGVVTVEAYNTPMVLEVVVGRLEDGSCWTKPLVRKQFQAYRIALRVRGNDRHVVGKISATVQTHVEDSFPFEVYMDEVQTFAFRVLEETLLQNKNVIRNSKMFTKLCETITQDPPEPNKFTTPLSPPDNGETTNNRLPPMRLTIEYRNKKRTSKKGKAPVATGNSSFSNRTSPTQQWTTPETTV